MKTPNRYLPRLVVVVFTVFALATPVQAVAPIVVAFWASSIFHGGLLLLKLNGVDPSGSGSGGGSGGGTAGGTGGSTGGATGGSTGEVTVNLPPFNSEPLTKPNGWEEPNTPPPVSPASDHKCRAPNGGLWEHEQVWAYWANDWEKKIGSGIVYSPGGNCTLNSNRQPLVGTKVSTPSCPSGYLMQDGQCHIVDYLKPTITKPLNTPCEFVWNNGQYKPDPMNPSCKDKSQSDPVPIHGDSCTYSVGLNGESKFVCGGSNTAVKINPDSISVTDPAGNTATIPTTTLPDGSRAFNNPVNPAGGTPSGAASVSGATVSGGGGVIWNGTGWGPDTSGTGTGDGGTGTGDGGTGGGTGGGDGTGTGTQTGPLDLNDSGFKGLSGDSALNSANKADKEAVDGLNSKIEDNFRFLDSLESFVPTPQSFSECRPIPITIISVTFEWDFCKYTDIISVAMGYLFYMFTAIYLYRLFTSSSKD